MNIKSSQTLVLEALKKIKTISPKEALKLSNDLKSMMKISIGFSLLTAVLGLVIANGFDLPLGATMASFQFLLFVLIIKIKK